MGERRRAPAEALREYADQHAPALVAEAHAEAIAEARRTLAEAMTAALVEGGLRHLRGERENEPPARAASGDQGEAVYVYGVAAATDPPRLPDGLEGVSPGAGPTLLEHGGLAVITSAVPLRDFDEENLHANLNDVAWLERTARAHEDVLAAACDSTTVVPLRLCTIYRDGEQVREMLERERAVFVDALERLRGKTEWGVKLYAEPGALERAAAAHGQADEGGGGELSPGAAYMSRRSDEARSRELADGLAGEWVDLVHGRVAALAVEALVNPVQAPEATGREEEMLLNGVYLVEDANEAALAEEVTSLVSQLEPLGAIVEITGPWPAYNFVKGSIEAAR